MLHQDRGHLQREVARLHRTADPRDSPELGGLLGRGSRRKGFAHGHLGMEPLLAGGRPDKAQEHYIVGVEVGESMPDEGEDIAGVVVEGILPGAAEEEGSIADVVAGYCSDLVLTGMA